MAGHGAIGGLGRSLRDEGAGVDEAGGTLVRLPRAATAGASGTQLARRVAAQAGALRVVDGPVDALRGQVPLGAVGELLAQRVADLLRAPAPVKALLHELTQLRDQL